MAKLSMLLLLGPIYAALAACPERLAAQLVQQNNPTVATRNSESNPSGKRRLSQEIQITGEQSWTATGIEVKPGEHIVVTAKGTLRYADAKEDNGPDGIARGFKDLLRILPFNGAHRDVVAPVAGPLAIGINQVSDDTGDGTYTVRIDVLAPDSEAVYRPARQVKSISGVDANIW